MDARPDALRSTRARSLKCCKSAQVSRSRRMASMCLESADAATPGAFDASFSHCLRWSSHRARCLRKNALSMSETGATTPPLDSPTLVWRQIPSRMAADFCGSAPIRPADSTSTKECEVSPSNRVTVRLGRCAEYRAWSSPRSMFSSFSRSWSSSTLLCINDDEPSSSPYHSDPSSSRSPPSGVPTPCARLREEEAESGRCTLASYRRPANAD